MPTLSEGEAPLNAPPSATQVVAAAGVMRTFQHRIYRYLEPFVRQSAIEGAGLVIAANGRADCICGTLFSDKNLQTQVWRSFEAHVQERLLDADGTRDREAQETQINASPSHIAVEIPSPLNAPRAFVVASVLPGGEILNVEDLSRICARLSSGLFASLSADGGVSDSDIDTPPDPLSEFLLRTLIDKPVMRGRNNSRFVTVRAWRTPIKPFQIDALRCLKRAPPAALVDRIARDLLREIDKLIGRSAFEVIVPMPCGNSGSEKCLSVRIADRLGGILQLPVANALQGDIRRGSSHPKENARRQPMRLATPVSKSALVVDDVATSGQHLEEALALLRPSARAAVGIAWIGGETS